MRVLSLLSLAAVCAALVAPCLAQSGSSSSTGVGQASLLANTSDATVVNFALTLERLDSTFWSCYLNSYNVTNQPYCAYLNGGVVTQFGQTDFTNAGYNATVWQAVNLIAAEEVAHAALLNATVMALGYAPVSPCQYQFPGVTSVATYLAQGLAFETAGTAAYAGAINGLTNPALVQAAASIASVEARHAGYLANLLGMQPFASSGFNAAYNASTVAAIISPYYVSQTCLAQTMLPAVRPFGVTYQQGSNATGFTGSYVNPYGVTYTTAQRTNDLATLNYALILEDLESAFYANASAAFTSAQYTAAGFNTSVPLYLSIIAANEATHVATLTAVIGAYGGTPVQSCTYNFSALGFNAFSSIQNYLTYASALEGVGVMAYDGAANTITDTYLLQVAAQIDMIEARHVAFINSVLYATPNVSNPTNVSQVFPTVTDTPMTPLAVFQLVTGLGIITGCGGQTVTLPGVVTPLPGATPGANTTLLTPGGSSSGGFVFPSSSSGGAGYNGSSAGYNGAAAAASSQWMLLVVAAASAIVAMML